MASTTQNLYQCRLCLKRTPTRVNIFGGDFPKMLEILTSIKVRENDGLPKYSCTRCAIDVKSALIIKKRIIKAHKYLIENLGKRKIPSTSHRKATVQAQSSKTAILKPTKISELDKCTESKQVAAPNYLSAVCINENTSQNSENPSEDVTPKIEVKLEVLDESQNIEPKVEVKLEDLDERQDSNDVSIAAEECGGSTNEIGDKVNRKTANEQISYTCKECNISFTTRSAYSSHCGKHKKTKCDTCNKMIRSDNFHKHLRVHSTGPSICNLCGATYKNSESLRSHISKHHHSLAYVCEECGKGFKIKYNFMLHKTKVHTGERNFKCETCGKAFFTNYMLRTHDKMTHKKLKPHICEFCGTGFFSKHSLRTHKRQHTNERPYVCDHCSEGFKQRVSLRSHLKSKHGIEEAKESICSECGKGFATKFALNIHQRLHASIKCGVCSESFASQEYLDNHMKEAHGVDNVMEDESHDTEENHEES